MWSDVWRACADPRSPARWFVHVDVSCDDSLSARKQALREVIDRYDYVLMLGPARHGQELMASHLRLSATSFRLDVRRRTCGPLNSDSTR